MEKESLITYLSFETVESTRQQEDTFKVLKEKDVKLEFYTQQQYNSKFKNPLRETKQKQNTPKHMGCSKAMFSAYIKKE